MRNLMKFLLCFMVLILMVFPLSVSALSTGFDTTPLSKDAARREANSMFIEKLDEESIPFSGIICMDINEGGDVLVAFRHFYQVIINVYDSKGGFKYGLSLNNDNFSGAEWDGNNISIYDTKSYFLTTVDRNGNGITAAKVEPTAKNHDYYRSTMLATEKTFPGGKVVMSKSPILNVFGILTTQYSTVTVTDISGKETVIADVTAYEIVRLLVVSLLIIALIVCIAIMLPKIVAKVASNKDKSL